MGEYALNNHRTGAITELRAAIYFVSKGCEIYWPQLTQSKADFVIDSPEGLKKVQVKRATWSTTGPYKYLQCRLVSRNKYQRGYKDGDFDIIVFMDDDDMWVTSFESVKGMTSVCLSSTNPTYTPQTDYCAEDWRVKDEA